MSDLNDKFVTLEGLLADQNTAILAALSTLQSTQDTMQTTLTALNDNQATNARLLLNAIGNISACTPCPLPSLTTPPLGTTTPGISNDACKRVQAFLHAVETILTYGDYLINGGLFASPSNINDMIAQAIDVLENPDTTPLPSWTEVVVIAADVASWIVNNLVNGDTFVGDFTPLESDLQDAMFNAGNVAAIKAAYMSTIDASSTRGYAKPVFKQIAYDALFTYYFDPSTTPNLTGYSGTVCTGVGSGCTDDFNGLSGFSNYDSGNFNLHSEDYIVVGVAGGGGGTVGVYIDGVHVDDIPVAPGGHGHYYYVAAHSTYRTLGASGAQYFLLMQRCYGTKPSNF